MVHNETRDTVRQPPAPLFHHVGPSSWYHESEMQRIEAMARSCQVCAGHLRRHGRTRTLNLAYRMLCSGHSSHEFSALAWQWSRLLGASSLPPYHAANSCLSSILRVAQIAHITWHPGCSTSATKIEIPTSQPARSAGLLFTNEPIRPQG